VELVDTNTGLSYSLDLQNAIRHRDYFKIIQFATSSLVTTSSAPPVNLGEYDEGLIPFDPGYTEAGFGFNVLFTSLPIITFTVEPAVDSSHNINVFGIQFKTPYVCNVAISAPFSGNIRYRAINATSYPATCTSPYTSSFVASAGQVELAPDSTVFTASFASMGVTPSEFRISPYEQIGQYYFNNVALKVDHGSLTTTEVAGDISAPYSGVLDYIAYSSIVP